VRDPLPAEVGQQLHRAGERPSLGQDLAVELAVAALDRLGLLVGEGTPDLTCRGPGEEAAAHADAAVDPPAVDRESDFGERSLPGEHVRVDGVDERAVQVEDERPLRAVHPKDGTAALTVATC
jgi:hypothetical protein